MLMKHTDYYYYYYYYYYYFYYYFTTQRNEHTIGEETKKKLATSTACDQASNRMHQFERQLIFHFLELFQLGVHYFQSDK